MDAPTRIPAQKNSPRTRSPIEPAGQDCDAAALHLAQLRATYQREQAEARTQLPPCKGVGHTKLTSAKHDGTFVIPNLMRDSHFTNRVTTKATFAQMAPKYQYFGTDDLDFEAAIEAEGKPNAHSDDCC